MCVCVQVIRCFVVIGCSAGLSPLCWHTPPFPYMFYTKWARLEIIPLLFAITMQNVLKSATRFICFDSVKTFLFLFIQAYTRLDSYMGGMAVVASHRIVSHFPCLPIYIYNTRQQTHKQLKAYTDKMV